MRREMRRKDRAMPRDEARELLVRGEYGVLSTVGEDGLPYGVPLSYVVVKDHIYFHCALVGQKIDNLAACPEVSFCVVGKTQPVYDGNFTTYFESVLLFGKADKVEAPEEKREALTALAEKYLPDHMDKAPEDIQSSFSVTAVYRISIHHLTGKEKKKRVAGS